MSRVAGITIALLATLSELTGLAAAPALPFMSNDYPKAVAEAKQRRLPLFVEVWAPW